MKDSTIRLATLRAKVSNGAKPGELPSRLKVLDWGINKTLKGDVLVDETTLAVFDANQRSVGRDRVVLDYEHNTVPGTEEFNRSQEPRAIAGYWTPRVIRGEGLVLEAPRWVAPEKDVLKFEDVSAAPFLENGRVIGLHSVALTKAGASDFSFFSAPEIDAMVLTLSANQNPKGKNMNRNEVLVLLSALLGLAAESTEAELKQKLSTLSALGTENEKLRTEVTTLRAEVAALKNAAPNNIVVLSAEVDGKTITLKPDELVREVVLLRADRAAGVSREAETLIARFSAEGKVPKGEDGKELSADQLKTLSAVELRRLLANTPQTVPLSARSRTPGAQTIDPNLKGSDRAAAAWSHLKK